MDSLFLGMKGHVVSIDKTSGTEKWRTKLRTDIGGVTTIHCDGRQVYACSGGHLYCLDMSTGSIRWHNRLKGLGHGFCIMANADATASAASASSATAASTAATAAFVTNTGS